MAKTLDELLALFPDNTSGEIGADDLRTAITELFNAAHAIGDVTTYGWSASDSSPPNGKLWLDQGWSTASTSMALSETTAEGGIATFAAIDNPSQVVSFTLVSPTNARLDGRFTGPSTDQGTYRTIPVVITSATGTAPSNTDNLQTLYNVSAATT